MTRAAQFKTRCICVYFVGVRAARRRYLHPGYSRALHGRHGHAGLRTSRLPTAARRPSQAPTSGRRADDVTAARSPAIGRDAVTCSGHVLRDWLRVERLRLLRSDMPGRCADFVQHCLLQRWR